MPVIEELIKVEKDGSISFGNYELDTKAKLDNFDVNGDIYKVKTFNEIPSLRRMEILYTNRFREQRLTDLLQMTVLLSSLLREMTMHRLPLA